MGQWNKSVRRRSLIAMTLASATCLSVFSASVVPTAAVELGDGTTAFTSPPRLADFVTFETFTSERFPTYYVTVNLLPEAGEPLQTLTVSLLEGRFTRLDYRLDAIEVFEGTRSDRGTPYAIAAADYNDDMQTLTIQLAEPVAPGTLVTFALPLVRNPRWEGVYLYEVTAAPAGANPRFQRAGIGRIHIYERRFLLFH